MTQFAAQLLRGRLLDELIDQPMTRYRQPPRHLFQTLQHPQQLRGGQRLERQLTDTIHVSIERVEDLDDVLTATRTHVRILCQATDTNPLNASDTSGSSSSSYAF